MDLLTRSIRKRGWASPDVIGIDVGITLLMAENLRSGLVWQIFMKCPEVRLGMWLAGFRSDVRPKLPAHNELSRVATVSRNGAGSQRGRFTVALEQQLSRDAERDFVRMIRSELQPDGTMKLLRALRRHAVGDEFLAEDRRFGFAANAADVGKIVMSEGA